MKYLFMIAALLTSAISYGQSDSLIVPKSGVMYTDTVPRQMRYVVADTVIADTTMSVTYRDSAYVRYDTFYSGAFVPIEDYQLMEVAIPATALTVSLEEGDFSSYVVIRYTLWGFPGIQLYSNRMRIAGSCYQHFKAHGVQYVYWKVCHDKGFEQKED